MVFPTGDIPFLQEALLVLRESAKPITLEVQQLLDPRAVHTVALEVASGLQRGARVQRTGQPLTMPVGEALLGRLVDVLGRPTDDGPASIPQ